MPVCVCVLHSMWLQVVLSYQMICNYCTNFAGDFIVFTSLECNLRWSLCVN